MWTEHVPDEANLDSKVFPRMIALAEVLWSYPTNPNFEDFYKRIQKHYPILENFNIQYGFETIGTEIELEFTEESIKIVLNKKRFPILKYLLKLYNNARMMLKIPVFLEDVTY